MRGRRVGERASTTHLIYNPRQAREEAEGGEIKNHRPHTTTIGSSPVHPLDLPELPSYPTLFSLALSRPPRPPLCLRYRARRVAIAEKRPTRVWRFNSVRIGFPIERSLMASGHASKPRVTTICEMESQQGHKLNLFFPPGPSRRRKVFPSMSRGLSPGSFARLDPRRSVLFRPWTSLGHVYVRRQSSI